MNNKLAMFQNLECDEKERETEREREEEKMFVEEVIENYILGW